MGNLNLGDLLKRYHKGQCTDEEKLLIESWYAHLDFNVKDFTLEQLVEIQNLSAPYKNRRNSNTKIMRWAMIAALFLAIVTISVIYWKNQSSDLVKSQIVLNDVLPGSNQAILKLANGEELNLTDAANGSIALEDDILIQKSDDGELIYKSHSTDNDLQDNNLKNTVTTPKGGTYRLILTDGTKVWLNALSSITYPVKFSERKREVEITGEVYFEVTPNKSAPFKVKSYNQIVEVLGTQFNINAYNIHSSILTTLVEGKVSVHNSSIHRVLSPGQQSRSNNKEVKIYDVDIYEEIAWKNGDFVFKQQPIQEIMNQLARWYDIELDYSSYTDRKETYSGEISRSRNLSAVLKLLEKTNAIRFKIDKNKLYIINN